jgi:hypothetical protein
VTAVYAWSPAHTVVWPRSGGAGACSHQPPDSCSYCDGSLDHDTGSTEARSDARKAANR